MKATFPKSEKLCGEQAVDCLYKEGKRFVVWPVRVTYLPLHGAPTQVLIWAPKVLFKHAVDRNRAKRLIRDWIAYNEKMMRDDWDYIFVIRRDILNADRDSGREAMRKALHYLRKQEINEQ